MRRKIITLFRNESGATAIEYGLIASLIALTIIAALNGVSSKLSGTFNNIRAKL